MGYRVWGLGFKGLGFRVGDIYVFWFQCFWVLHASIPAQLAVQNLVVPDALNFETTGVLYLNCLGDLLVEYSPKHAITLHKPLQRLHEDFMPLGTGCDARASHTRS